MFPAKASGRLLLCPFEILGAPRIPQLVVPRSSLCLHLHLDSLLCVSSEVARQWILDTPWIQDVLRLWRHLQRPYFQIKSGPYVLGLGTWTYLLGRYCSMPCILVSWIRGGIKMCGWCKTITHANTLFCASFWVRGGGWEDASARVSSPQGMVTVIKETEMSRYYIFICGRACTKNFLKIFI